MNVDAHTGFNDFDAWVGWSLYFLARTIASFPGGLIFILLHDFDRWFGSGISSTTCGEGMTRLHLSLADCGYDIALHGGLAIIIPAERLPLPCH